MPFKPTQEQKEQLAQFGSNYKFINRGPLRERKAHGELEVTDPAFTICELRDQITGKPWAEGKGGDRAEALADALSKANPGHKPKTTAQILAENAELKAQLEEAKQGKKTKATRTRATKKPESDSPVPEPAE